MTPRLPASKREKDPQLRCKSIFNHARCQLRSGHRGPHHHDGGAGNFQWGGRTIVLR